MILYGVTKEVLLAEVQEAFGEDNVELRRPAEPIYDVPERGIAGALQSCTIEEATHIETPVGVLLILKGYRRKSEEEEDPDVLQEVYCIDVDLVKDDRVSEVIVLKDGKDK